MIFSKKYDRELRFFSLSLNCLTEESSHPQSVTSSNQKRKTEDSIMVTCKRTKFLKTYYQQNFSMPDSIIFYIAKNPKTAALYLKMVKTCKYFFVKNQIIVIDHLQTSYGKWMVKEKPLDLTKYNCKYWITDEICVSASESVDKNILLPIIPKLYQCDVKRLYLFSQVVSFNDLSLLILSAERIHFNNIIVKKCDSVIPLEDIITIAVNAKTVYAHKPKITPKTMKQLLQIPHFATLVHFGLYALSEVFDIEAFYSYMKKNQHTKFYISFFPQPSDAFKNRLETIIDEILETEQFNYKPPQIRFSGLDFQKYEKLRRICNSH
uniref:DUF3822 family protein n=1 Tax=Panagrolaimus davidi TaxID=227884 RepID=A0A914PD76_9BILA